MNELKPEDVMRALENGRYIDADEFWNSRPENPNPNKEGRYIDGWFDCLDRFLRHLKEMADEPSITKAALALLREKDALLEKWDADLKTYEAILMSRDAEIERLEKRQESILTICDRAMNQMICSGAMNHYDTYEKAKEILKAEARAEAITEFAERLKAALKYFIISRLLIDRIAQEMKGEIDGNCD